MKTVYTTGVFDILHPGHIWILKKARERGDRLIVGVQDDESVFLQKGKYPVMSIKERMAILKAMPFVDKCVAYSDIDQRPILARLKPQVMVQIDEWLKQADRSAIIKYLKEHHIRLVIVPVKKTISSTIIKNRVVERVANFRDDISILRNNLTLWPIKDLMIYERFDPKRVKRLVARLRSRRQFNNPIAVARYHYKYIVIDGANRLEALKRMGAQRAFVFLFDYDDEAQVELRSNVHFLSMDKATFERGLKRVAIGLERASKIKAISDLSGNRVAAITVIDGQYYRFIGRPNWPDVDLINAVVGSYIKKQTVYRLSEFSQNPNDGHIQIIFRRFTVPEIAALTESSQYLASGVTWHQLKRNAVRLNVPLSQLSSRVSLEAARSWLRREIDKKIFAQDVRYYPFNIYLGGEWS